ncbi:MAG TPA: hypothetical protein VFI65_19230 [Streptosporangiaceae bacterium]|nr:hypothetical protein [Streptosporangiaceae bacterium]
MAISTGMTRLLGLILVTLLGLVLALAVVSGSHPGRIGGPGVLATGTASGGPVQPPHPNV